MTDVFISYSRRDKVFTQKLYEALKAVNREVWAHWDSIPASSDWDAEIKEGIEKTESVLFLLSPEWIKSNECRKELNHAVTMGKRLLPILYIMPDQGQEVPPELGKINWVYMRDTDDFDKAFQTLCSAMDTDLEWVKSHTRIQVRALEWDKKNRDNSFALHGKDLAEGEQFIAGAAHKSPEPTTLQGEYVLASRKDANRRQRLTLTGVTIALIVSVALGVVALWQRGIAKVNENTAIANAQEAEKQKGIAQENEKTAIANEQEAIRQAKISLSRQLVAQASNLPASDIDTALLLALAGLKNLDTTSGRQTIMSLINSQPNLVGMMRGYPAKIHALAFSPDGKFLVSLGCSALSDERDHSWKCPGYDVRLWDVASHKLVGMPFRVELSNQDEFDFKNVDQFSLSLDGTSVTIPNGSVLEIRNSATGELTHTLPAADTTQEDFTAGQMDSPDGKLRASAECLRGEGYTCVGGVIKLYSADPAPRGIADLDLAAVPDFNPSGAFSFTADGSRVGLVDDATGQLAYFDTTTGGLDSIISNISVLGDGVPVSYSNLSPAGDMAIKRTDESIYLFNLANPSGGRTLQPAQPDGVVQGLKLSSDGRYLMILLYTDGCCSYVVEVWNTQKLEMIASAPQQIYTNFGGELGGQVTSTNYTMSNDGHYFASTNGDTLDIWDLHEASQLPSLPAPLGIRVIALSADGKLAIPLPNRLIVLDIHSGTYLADLSWPANDIESVFFGRDSGNLFAVILNQAYYSDPFSGLERPQQQLLWDLVGIRSLQFPPLVDAIVQSPDGRQLLMREANYKFFTFQTNYESWQEQVCQIASRNLNPSEWSQYIGDILPYQALCVNLPLETEATSTPTVVP